LVAVAREPRRAAAPPGGAGGRLCPGSPQRHWRWD
jgi:hypothetical protein